jgi:hypothetical protein
LGILEGESVQTNTDSQPKKLLSRKKLLQKIRENDWNPFERVDGKLLEKLARELGNQKSSEYEEALL